MIKHFLFAVMIFPCLEINAQAGQLDPSFGKNGIVATDIGSPYDYGTFGKQVLLAPNGAIYVIIEMNGLTAVAKRYRNGTPDIRYGNAGFSAAANLYPSQAAIQADGKIVVAGQAYTYGNEDFGLARFNADGSLDTAFARSGMQTTDFGSPEDFAYGIAVQADRKIVVAGQTFRNDSSLFALARYNPNGSLDHTFGNNGKETTDFGSYASASSIAIETDGKIVVSGSTFGGLAIGRYNLNGSLDKTFNNNGKKITDFDFYSDASHVSVQGDGKIVIAGAISRSNNYDFVVLRYNPDGSSDKTFSDDGKAITNFLANAYAQSLAIQTDGKIVVAGYTDLDGSSDFALARYNTDGTPDNSFSGDGKQVTDFGSFEDMAYSVALQSDGKIISGGFTYAGGSNNFAVARYNADGQLDKSFDKDGKLFAQLLQGNTFYRSIAVQADGKIIAAGFTWNGSDLDFAIARYNRDGNLDKTFSRDGKQTTDVVASNDYALSVAIQADGKIVVAGFSNSHSLIVRYNPDGTLDKTFNGDGLVSTVFGYADVFTSVAIQGNGKIVAAGYVFRGSNFDSVDFALARYNTDGTLDNSFGLRGEQITDFGGSEDFIESIALEKKNKIVAVGYSWNGSSDDFVLARYTEDGRLDKTFSNDGRQRTDFSEYNDFAESVAIQNNGKIVVGGFTETESGSNSEFAIARYCSDGKLDKSFSDDGKQTTDFGFNSLATSVVIQKDGKLLLIGGSNFSFALSRYNEDGTFDNTFGKGGLQLTPASGGDDFLYSAAISNNTLYAAGYGEYPGDFGTVASYLIGPLDQNPKVTRTDSNLITIEESRNRKEVLAVTVSPNPTTTYFSLFVKSSSEEKYDIRVVNNLGKITDLRKGLSGNMNLHLGQNFLPGVYFLQVIQGAQTKRIIMIKGR